MQDNSKRVILLDIDGVLQPTYSQKRFSNNLEELQRMLADKYQNSGYLDMDKWDLGAVYYDWNLEAVANLEKLITVCKAEIVVSSDWRRSNDLEQLKLLFQIHGLGVFVSDATPTLGVSRDKEISAYLSEHSDIENFVIIDDIDTGFSKIYPDNFVHTADRGHFTEHHLNVAITILTQQDFAV